MTDVGPGDLLFCAAHVAHGFEDISEDFCVLGIVKAPERKSLTEAAGQSGCAGVKLRQQMAFVGKRQGPGDEERGALCSGSLRGSD